MANMLADVVNAGTAYRARATGFNLPAAGKTGTTNDYVDAWFVGFTPKLVAGVWMGFDQPQTIVANGYGGELAAPVWGEFMKVATQRDKPEWLKQPANVVGVEMCRMSGRRPADGLRITSTCVSKTRRDQDPLDGLHRVLRVAAASRTTRAALHQDTGLLTRMAELFGGDRPRPVDAQVEGASERPNEPAVAKPPGSARGGRPEPAGAGAGEEEARLLVEGLRPAEEERQRREEEPSAIRRSRTLSR